MATIMLVYITLNWNHTLKFTVLVGHFVFKNPVKQPSSPVVFCSSMVWASDQCYKGFGLSLLPGTLKIFSVVPSPIVEQLSLYFIIIIIHAFNAIPYIIYSCYFTIIYLHCSFQAINSYTVASSPI